MTFPIVIRIVKPDDARGWIGFGAYSLVIIILLMIYFSDKNLLDNDAFLILATAIIITGWVNGPVSWAYAATKGGGEAAESSARIAETAMGVAPHEIPAPQSAVEGANQVKRAAQDEAANIAGEGRN